MVKKISDNSAAAVSAPKSMEMGASSAEKVIPKLCTQVLSTKIGNNTVLTFLANIDENKAHIIERVVIDDALRKSLIDVLQGGNDKYA